MRYTITEVEQALINALRSTVWQDLTIPTIEGYSGQVEDIVNGAMEAIYPTPALFVVYQGSDFTEVANRAWDEAKRFYVAVIVKDLRQGEAMRDTMFNILDQLKRTIVDNDLGLDTGPVTLVRTERVLFSTAYCIYTLELRLRDIT